MSSDSRKCPNCGVQMDVVEDTDMQICPNCKTLAWEQSGELQWRVPQKISEAELEARQYRRTASHARLDSSEDEIASVVEHVLQIQRVSSCRWRYLLRSTLWFHEVTKSALQSKGTVAVGGRVIPDVLRPFCI